MAILNLITPFSDPSQPLLETNPWIRYERDLVKIAVRRSEKSRFQDIDPNNDDVYCITKWMKRDNQDVVGDMCVRNDASALTLDHDAKKKAWKEHYERLERGIPMETRGPLL